VKRKEKLIEKVKYIVTLCINNMINNWNYIIVEKVYVSMMKTLDSELGIKHAKWDDDKLIYDVNDEESTSFFCTWNKN